MNKKGISLVALVITIIVMIILTGAVVIRSIGDGDIISNSSIAAEQYRAREIVHAISMAVSNNALAENVGGTYTTKQGLIEDLKQQRKLTNEEIEFLKVEDTIEIAGVTVDFSVLNSSILISPNVLLLNAKEDGTAVTEKLRAVFRNIDGDVTWEIISGEDYISLQESKGDTVTVVSKGNGIAKVVAKSGDYTSAPCTVVTASYFVKNSEELKSALNEVQQNQTIYLNAGIYEEEIHLCRENNITPLKNVSILGAGNVTVSAIDLKGSQNIVIEGINFDVSKAVEAKNHNNAGQQGYYASIYDNNVNNPGARNITINNCIFEGAIEQKYISIYNYDQGFSGTRSTNFEINGCQFKCNAFAYINFSYADNGYINISNNVFGGNDYSTTYANMFFSTGYANLTVDNNTFNNWANGSVAIELMGPADSEAAPRNIPTLIVTNNTFNKTTIPANDEKAVKYGRGKTAYNVSNNEYIGNVNYLLDSTAVTHTIHKSLQ